jgi:hypothetical protein
MPELVSLFTKLAFIMPSSFKGTIVHIVIMLINSGNDINFFLRTTICELTDNFCLIHQQRQAYILFCPSTYKELAALSTLLVVTRAGFLKDFVM